jgi:hypothetical protein
VWKARQAVGGSVEPRLGVEALGLGRTDSVAAARFPEFSEGERKLMRGDFGSAFGLSRKSGLVKTL